MCVIKIQVINCNLNVCGHTVQQSPPPYDLLTSLLVPLALCLEPTGICMCTPWTRGWRLMNILFKYTLKRKGKSPLESVPIWISLSYFFASGLQKRSRSPPTEIQENLWTFGEYLIKTHHTISQILKGWRNVSTVLTNNILCKSLSSMAKKYTWKRRPHHVFTLQMLKHLVHSLQHTSQTYEPFVWNVSPVVFKRNNTLDKQNSSGQEQN